MTNLEIQTIDKEYYLPVFNRFPISLVKGKGCQLWDAEGKQYLDALAGIAVCSTGHCHPKITQAIAEQAGKLIHVSNFFSTEPQALLAKKLAEKSGFDYTFCTNSGAESMETAIKLARKYAHKNGKGGTIISMKNCFHGRTMATIATGSEKLQKGFEPIPDGFIQAVAEDQDSVLALINDEVAAIAIEPIQGEGGIRPISDKFLTFLREVCDQHNILLIFDEIQCGIARTGTFLAFQQCPIRPDIVALAKGLGSGFPIGATLCTQKVGSVMNFGDHGTTFGGNPLACAAALATISVIEEEQLTEGAKSKGDWFKAELEKRLQHNPDFETIRGKGLMLGVVLKREALPVVLKMLDLGVIANATAGNVIRFLPPLVINKEELEKVIITLEKAMALTK